MASMNQLSRISCLSVLLLFALSFQLSACSDYVAQYSNPLSTTFDRNPRTQLRRCISRSSQMSREADIDKTTWTCCDAPAYYPAHSQLPQHHNTNSVKDDSYDSHYSIDFRSVSLKRPLRQESRIYTQLQTQLFPNIRF